MNMNRRNFLKRGGGAVAGTATGGASAVPPDPLRAAINSLPDAVALFRAARNDAAQFVDSGYAGNFSDDHVSAVIDAVVLRTGTIGKIMETAAADLKGGGAFGKVYRVAKQISRTSKKRQDNLLAALVGRYDEALLYGEINMVSDYGRK